MPRRPDPPRTTERNFNLPMYNPARDEHRRTTRQIQDLAEQDIAVEKRITKEEKRGLKKFTTIEKKIAAGGKFSRALSKRVRKAPSLKWRDVQQHGTVKSIPEEWIDTTQPGAVYDERSYSLKGRERFDPEKHGPKLYREPRAREPYKASLRTLAKHGLRTAGKTIPMAHSYQTSSGKGELITQLGKRGKHSGYQIEPRLLQNRASIIREVEKAHRYSRVFSKLSKKAGALGLAASAFNILGKRE